MTIGRHFFTHIWWDCPCGNENEMEVDIYLFKGSQFDPPERSAECVGGDVCEECGKFLEQDKVAELETLAFERFELPEREDR